MGYKQPQSVQIREVDDGIVLLNSETGSYFGLDGAGARIFFLLVGGKSLPEVADQIVAEFDTDRERVLRDCEMLRREI